MFDRSINQEIEAARDVASQIVRAVAMPDGGRPTRGSGDGAGAGVTSGATPRTVEGEDGQGTIYQFFTELDSTETDASFF